MPLIHGTSDKTRSKNIAKLRREGYPAKQAEAISYRIQRQERAKMRRRGRRNPVHRHKHHKAGKKGMHWGWLLGGGAVGGLATTGYTITLPAPTSQTYIDNAVAGIGGGMVLGGIIGGLINKSFITGAGGLLSGAAVLGIGLLISPNPTPTAGA